MLTLLRLGLFAGFLSWISWRRFSSSRLRLMVSSLRLSLFSVSEETSVLARYSSAFSTLSTDLRLLELQVAWRDLTEIRDCSSASSCSGRLSRRSALGWRALTFSLTRS